MSLGGLPLELIDLIAGHSRQVDLLNLARVSKAWYQPARKNLMYECTSPMILGSLVTHLFEHPRLWSYVRYFRYEPAGAFAKLVPTCRDFKQVIKWLLLITANCDQLRFFKSTALPPLDSDYHNSFYAALSTLTHLDDLQLGDHSNQITTDALANVLGAFRKLTRLKARVDIPFELDEEGNEDDSLGPLPVCEVSSLTLVLTGALSNKRLMRLAEATFSRTHSLVLDLTKSGTITPEGIKDAMKMLPPSLHRLGFYAPKVFPSTVPSLFGDMFPKIHSCNLDARRDPPAALDALPPSIVRLRIDTGHKVVEILLPFLDKLIELLKTKKLQRLELLRMGCKVAVEEGRVRAIEHVCRRLDLPLVWLEDA